MKLNLSLNLPSRGRGFGVTRSPYLGRPRRHTHLGHNYDLGRMQASYDLYLFGLHFWLVW